MANSVSHLSFVLSVILLCTQVNTVLSVDGRLFYLAFMNPSTTTPNDGIQEIHVSGIKDTLVRVSVLPYNYSYLYKLDSANKWAKTLQVNSDMAGPSGVNLPVSFIISSQEDISVQCNKAEDGTAGGYLALPINSLDTEYYVASYTPKAPSAGFSVAATDYTCVTVYRVGPDDQDIREMDFNLDPGQVRHVSFPDDSTGRRVQTKKPVVLFGGLDCAYINKDTQSSLTKCDFITEQLPNTGSYGQVFIMRSFYGRLPNKGFQIRVVSKDARTVVKWATYDLDPTTGAAGAPVVNPSGSKTVPRGQFLEITIGNGNAKPQAVVLTCSVGCLVMQYGESNDMLPTGAENGIKPDSTMVTVPDVTLHYTTDITFSTSKVYQAQGNQTTENVNELTVIVKQNDLQYLQLDGQPLQGALSNAIVSPKIDFAALTSGLGGSGVTLPSDSYVIVAGGLNNPGFHKVTANGGTNVKFTVFVYGYSPSTISSDSSSYAYLGGFKYNPQYGQPITEGPWFNFDGPVGDSPIMVTEAPNPGNNNPPVTPTEFPSYESIWEARFYIVKPQRADLRTKNCSEAYERYYLEQRWAPKLAQVMAMVASQCNSGVNVTMKNLLYYNEYSDGLIRFLLSVTGKGDATLNDMMDCLYLVQEQIGPIANWCPEGYVDETSFLKPDAYYNKGCDRLHMRTPNFESFYYGWQCPYLGGVLGASHASNLKASIGFLSLLTIAVAFLLQLR